MQDLTLKRMYNVEIRVKAFERFYFVNLSFSQHIQLENKYVIFHLKRKINQPKDFL